MLNRPVLIVAVALFGFVALATVPAHPGGGGGCRQPATDHRGIRVEMQGSCFTPTVVRIPVHGQVTWVNQDAQPHLLTGANTAWGTTGLVRQGETIAHRFDVAGVFPYHCSLHAGMVGAVVVGGGTPPEPRR